MAIEDHTALEMFRYIAAEFSDIGDPEVNFYFDLAGNTMATGPFGDTYRQALVYLAAHLMSLDKRAEDSGGGGGGVGPLTGERAGEVSRNFGYSGGTSGNAMDQSLYGTTVYGIRYLAIRRGRALTKAVSTQQHTPWPTRTS